MLHMIDQVMKDRRFQLIGTVLSVFIFTSLVWWGYRSYRESVNERAQLALASQLAIFEQTRDNQKVDKQMWLMVVASFEKAYKEHMSSDLAPFFLAFQAEASLQAGDRDQAIVLLERAVKAMGTSSPLYFLYATKLGLVRLDSDVNEVHERGKKDLLALAENSRNPHRGLAWYYLWHHAWIFGDTELSNLAMTKLGAFQRQGAQLGLLAKEKVECAV